MRVLATALAAGLMAVVAGGAGAAEQTKRDERKAQEPRPGLRPRCGTIYARLAVSADEDETEGLVGLFRRLCQSGSERATCCLSARTRRSPPQDDDAAEILDAASSSCPKAEAWNARATLRFLDDDYDGSMADIAETLKREPRHFGALIGMASILESRDKKGSAQSLRARARIAPHWKTAEEAAAKLKAEVAGQEL